MEIFNPEKLRKDVYGSPYIKSHDLLQLANLCDKNGFKEAGVELVAASIVQNALISANETMESYNSTGTTIDDTPQKPTRLRFAADMDSESEESTSYSNLTDF